MTKSKYRIARMVAGYSLSEAARIIGVSKQHLSAIELEYHSPSARMVKAMTELYNMKKE